MLLSIKLLSLKNVMFDIRVDIDVPMCDKYYVFIQCEIFYIGVVTGDWRDAFFS